MDFVKERINMSNFSRDGKELSASDILAMDAVGVPRCQCSFHQASWNRVEVTGLA